MEYTIVGAGVGTVTVFVRFRARIWPVLCALAVGTALAAVVGARGPTWLAVVGLVLWVARRATGGWALALVALAVVGRSTVSGAAPNMMWKLVAAAAAMCGVPWRTTAPALGGLVTQRRVVDLGAVLVVGVALAVVSLSVNAFLAWFVAAFGLWSWFGRAAVARVGESALGKQTGWAPPSLSEAVVPGGHAHAKLT